MINIAILASGSGTNAEAIVNHFQNHSEIRVVLILSNKQNAGVLDRADRLGIQKVVFSKTELESENFIELLKEKEVGLIILAGFLLKIPALLISSFPNKIINIHPALLPKYGGKGMYGHYVHEAVLNNKEKESGITIHLVNEAYDEGRHLFQVKLKVNDGESPDELASRIHKLEHQYFSEVVEKYALGLL